MTMGGVGDADCFLTIILEGPNDAGEAIKDDSYTGFAGGPLLGPTMCVQSIAMQTHDLASIFLQYCHSRSSPR